MDFFWTFGKGVNFTEDFGCRLQSTRLGGGFLGLLDDVFCLPCLQDLGFAETILHCLGTQQSHIQHLSNSSKSEPEPRPRQQNLHNT